jgi:hypothetical protein
MQTSSILFLLCIFHILYLFWSYVFITSQPMLDVGELTDLTLTKLADHMCVFLLQQVVTPTGPFHNPPAWDVLQIYETICVIYSQKNYLRSFKTLIVIFKTANCYACRVYIWTCYVDQVKSYAMLIHCHVSWNKLACVKKMKNGE